MEKLKELLSEVWDEYEGASKYLHMAAKVRDDDVSAANIYTDLAKQEMNHAQILYDMAERCVQKHAENPDGHDWKIIWDWEKGKLMDRKAKVHSMLH